MGRAQQRSATKTRLALSDPMRTGSRPAKSRAISAPSSRTRTAISAAERWISPIRLSAGKLSGSAGEVEVEMLGEALEVAPVEELDPDILVPRTQLAQLPVLAGDERLLHGGDLDVEVLVRQEEIGRE